MTVECLTKCSDTSVACKEFVNHEEIVEGRLKARYTDSCCVVILPETSG